MNEHCLRFCKGLGEAHAKMFEELQTANYNFQIKENIMGNTVTVNGVTLTEAQVEILGAIVASCGMGLAPSLTAEQKNQLMQIFGNFA